ncbi:DUF3592 domain-containing protein [Yinghuangia soli]|uniref:DUF3592 domain-containing protein n=1 Tax=Yinghuangia soli TaxID=2908204 RepID=A0AA41Q261_9ACTN|nr:DUF3592 domain-containing protein [Yinghuangia soli]MCF2529822.1 DUF3592 domain-containing protein [Yinghuangia soli]
MPSDQEQVALAARGNTAKLDSTELRLEYWHETVRIPLSRIASVTRTRWRTLRVTTHKGATFPVPTPSREAAESFLMLIQARMADAPEPDPDRPDDEPDALAMSFLRRSTYLSIALVGAALLVGLLTDSTMGIFALLITSWTVPLAGLLLDMVWEEFDGFVKHWGWRRTTATIVESSGRDPNVTYMSRGGVVQRVYVGYIPDDGDTPRTTGDTFRLKYNPGNPSDWYVPDRIDNVLHGMFWVVALLAAGLGCAVGVIMSMLSGTG